MNLPWQSTMNGSSEGRRTLRRSSTAIQEQNHQWVAGRRSDLEWLSFLTWLTRAVTGPPPKDYDFQIRVIGGSGSPLGSLLVYIGLGTKAMIIRNVKYAKRAWHTRAIIEPVTIDRKLVRGATVSDRPQVPAKIMIALAAGARQKITANAET